MRKPLQLLIVDDSPVCLMLTRGYVHSFRPDWVCTLAESAEQAMDFIKHQHYDAYSLDYNLPGCNGLELASWIRNRDQRCFIGLLTSNIMNHIEQKAMLDKINYYRKPAKPDVIQQLVDDVERYKTEFSNNLVK